MENPPAHTRRRSLTARLSTRRVPDPYGMQVFFVNGGRIAYAMSGPCPGRAAPAPLLLRRISEYFTSTRRHASLTGPALGVYLGVVAETKPEGTMEAIQDIQTALIMAVPTVLVALAALISIF
jgi:hypothetical protein